MNRRDFIKNTIYGTAFLSMPACVHTAYAEMFNDDKVFIDTAEYFKCKDDIVYFAEKHCRIRNVFDDDVKLKPVQKEYLRNLSSLSDDGDVFVCKKCRQAGITTLDAVYSVWKSIFYNNHRTLCLYLNRGMCKNAFAMTTLLLRENSDFVKMIKDISDNKIVFTNGSSIYFMTCYSDFAYDVSVYDNNTIIFDEFAYIGNNHARNAKIYENILGCCHDKNNRLIFVSTPYKDNDAFSTIFNSISDDNKMTITWKDIFPANHEQKVKPLIGKDQFDLEFNCKV